MNVACRWMRTYKKALRYGNKLSQHCRIHVFLNLARFLTKHYLAPLFVRLVLKPRFRALVGVHMNTVREEVMFFGFHCAWRKVC